LHQHTNLAAYRKRKNRKGVSSYFWLLLLFFSFAALFVAYLASPLALIAQVEVRGNQLLSAKDVQTLSGLEEGMHLWKVKLAACRDKLWENPWLAQVKISRRFPNSIRIDLEERRAAAVMQANGQTWVVAQDGTILTQDDGFSLPWLTGLHADPGLCPGYVLTGQTFKCAFHWVRALEPLSSQVSELNFASYPTSIAVFTTDGYKALFSPAAEPEGNVRDLEIMLLELRKDGAKGIIDFRAGNGKAVFSPWPTGNQD